QHRAALHRDARLIGIDDETNRLDRALRDVGAPQLVGEATLERQQVDLAIDVGDGEEIGAGRGAGVSRPACLYLHHEDIDARYVVVRERRIGEAKDGGTTTGELRFTGVVATG